MKYPFEFKELLLTEKVLNVLGFTEYWSGSGDFGDRNLSLGGSMGDERLMSKKEYPRYYIYEINESEDPESGYGLSKPEYCAGHYATKDWKTMYFLHEMYEDIVERRTPEEIECFIEITKKMNMYPYIESWLQYKEQITKGVSDAKTVVQNY